MITNVQETFGNQLDATYNPRITFNDSQSREPITPDETIEFLNQSTGKIKHPVLQSTLYNPQLEERIL